MTIYHSIFIGVIHNSMKKRKIQWDIDFSFNFEEVFMNHIFFFGISNNSSIPYHGMSFFVSSSLIDTFCDWSPCELLWIAFPIDSQSDVIYEPTKKNCIIV